MRNTNILERAGVILESQLHAAAIGASVSKGLVSMMCDLGVTKQFVSVIDANATEEIPHQNEIRRMKHVYVAHLHLQDEVESNRLKVRRVKSEHSVADLDTKALSRAVTARHADIFGYVNVSSSQQGR